MENEKWYKSGLLFFPRIISSLFSALSMDDKGWSLKKILAVFATWEAGKFTSEKLADNNVIVLVLIWIAYAGILVGIYSIADISNAMSQYKGTDKGIDPTPKP